MSNGVKVVAIVLVLSFVAIMGGAVLLSGATQVKPVDQDVLVGEARHATGNTDSTFTIVEFSDFQCPACGASYPEVKRVIEKYQDRVRFIYRHFPISISHSHAFEAAVASEIAGSQGKFWEMHDMLFDRQDEWAEAANVYELFAQYAEEIGITLEVFSKELTNPQYEELVNADMRDARTLGVNATPTLFVGDQKVTVQAFDGVLRDMLGE